MTLSVGLIGARGYVGRELLQIVAHHTDLSLAYASSREWAGRKVGEMLTSDINLGEDLLFEEISPDEAAQRRADVVFLGLPNGRSAPFVEAIDATAPDTILIDLSGDHRHDAEWTYGLPERNRRLIAKSRRIANPGCYATAAQLALLPLKKNWHGSVHCFGLSGWSGAGTTPSRRNDQDALRDNAIPYGLVGHAHEREIAAHAALDARFTPVVGEFFRGLVVIASGQLGRSFSAPDINDLYRESFADEPLVRLTEEPAEPAIAANTHHCFVSLPTLGDDGQRVVVTAALDNLLKGAASQAVQNLNIMMGWPETAGLRPNS